MVCKCRHEEHIGECRVAIRVGPVLVDLCRCTIEKPFPRFPRPSPLCPPQTDRQVPPKSMKETKNEHQ